MTRRRLLRQLPVRVLAASMAMRSAAWANETYEGPRPPKKDVPYLLLAQRLVETDAEEATESKVKRKQAFLVKGTTSKARTPLAEPIFLFLSDKIPAEQLGLFRLDVKDGNREVIVSGKQQEGEDKRSFHLSLRKLDQNLYRVEASESLNPGEYSLSPEGVNTAFCFTVY